MERNSIVRHQDLEIYQMAIALAMQVFEHTKSFPIAEKRLLTQQLLKSSRSVCANLAEAWGKRRYRAAFVAKLNEVEAEAGETQTWIELAVLCGYLAPEIGQQIRQNYDEVLVELEILVDNADEWIMPTEKQ
ncbi:four helix bundle protein [filamentous cyanobacterium CCP2]|nr:four helix bundle protein [filamentous cyanobacterium CCP2]